MSSIVCAWCGKKSADMYWCRQCRAHFCDRCHTGFISFKCPKEHDDVMRVRPS